MYILVFFFHKEWPNTLEEKSAKSWSDSPGNCLAIGYLPLVNNVT